MLLWYTIVIVNPSILRLIDPTIPDNSQHGWPHCNKEWECCGLLASRPVHLCKMTDRLLGRCEWPQANWSVWLLLSCIRLHHSMIEVSSHYVSHLYRDHLRSFPPQSKQNNEISTVVRICHRWPPVGYQRFSTHVISMELWSVGPYEFMLA